MKSKSAVISNLSQIYKKSKKVARSSKRKRSESRAIVIFDLSGSTYLKIKKGHDYAKRQLILHNEICSRITKKLHGKIIKELGDGVLASFDNPENACIAALSVQKLNRRKHISSKIVLTYGMVEELHRSGKADVIGNAIDRCAKLEKYAHSNQILIDRALNDVLTGFLSNYPDVKISKPMKTILSGHGEIELFEITHKNHQLINSLNPPFQIHENGRLQVHEKIAFMETAKKEILEIGAGIREFTRYFQSRNSSQFKDPVKKLLRRGIKLTCFAVDPNWILKNVKFLSSAEKEYYKEIKKTLNKLLEIKKEFSEDGLGSNFEIRIYKEFPKFHALCVDLNLSNGKMIISNYIPGIAKSQCPVLQFSKIANPTLFSRYKSGICEIIKHSKKYKKLSNLDFSP